MKAHDDDMTAATRASAAAIGRRHGTWTQWGRRRRRLVALIVANWVALGGVVAAGVALDELLVLVIGLAATLALDFWLDGRLHDAEDAEGAFDAEDTALLTPDEQKLYDEVEELEAAGRDREADLLLVTEVLAGNPVARRYEYPTRELLLVRSFAEVLELIGMAVVVATWPEPAGVATGGVVWVLGGRSGASVTRTVLGQRLYRSPVDDATRERWLKLEDRLTIAALVILAVVAIQMHGI